MTINERINRIMKYSDRTVMSFSKDISISHQSLRMIVEGKTKPSYETLQNILISCPNISADWLLLERGEMVRESEVSDALQDVSVRMVDNDYLADRLERMTGKYYLLDAEHEKLKAAYELLKTSRGNTEYGYDCGRDVAASPAQEQGGVGGKI